MTDKQSVFNTAVKGLASQGFKKSEGDRGCLYNGPDERHCAIGWINTEIPQSLEMWGPVQLLNKKLIPDIGSVSFYEGLQCCHDDAHSPEDMKRRLREFALGYGLEVPSELVD